MSQYSDSNFDKKDHNTSWHKTFTLIPEGSLVLDIGCSTGTFGERLINEKNCTVDGIDINQEDLAVANKRLRNTHVINIETDPIAIKEKYDIIFMGDVIEHLARPIETLKKIKELLKKDGRLVYSIPNITHISVRLMLLKGEIDYGRTGLLDETHLHFYNSKEIYRVFNSAGLDIETFDYTVNDLPRDVITDELHKIGLTVEDEFMKLVQSLDAAAYQFVGVAKVGRKREQKLPKVSPLNIIDKYHRRLKREYKANLNRVVADRDKIKREKEHIQHERDALLEQNKKLKSSVRHRSKQLVKKMIEKLH